MIPIKKYSVLGGLILILFVFVCAFVVWWHSASIGSDTVLTLDQLRFYHNNYRENVHSDQGSWSNPTYRLFHDANQSIFVRLKRFLGLKQKDLWNGKDFGILLRRAIALQKTVKKEGSCIVSTLEDDTHLIVISDLHASFHELVRILEDLYARSILNRNLEIIDSRYKLVFLGNMLNRYAYSLETFFVLLSLLDRNHDKVIYIKGSQELLDNWKDYDMKYALEKRWDGYESLAVPYDHEITRFFEGLPNSFVVQDADGKGSLLFSHDGILKDRGSFARGIDQRRQSLLSFFDTIKNVRALVRGEDLSRSFVYGQGLVLLKPEYGITTWSVLSASNYVYQAVLNILEDSYVQVSLKSCVEKSSIALYTRPFRGQKHFNRVVLYNIVTGQKFDNAADVVFVEDRVKTFGSSVALKKIATDLGRGVQRAISSVFEEQNKNGGVNGVFLRSFVLDDRYNPELARENVEFFIKEGIKYNLVPTGSPTLGSYIDLVKDGKISVLFPMTGTTWFREAHNKNIVHVRASYKDEVFALIDYLINVYGAKKFALFYLLAGSNIPRWCHEALEKNGIKTWLGIPFTRVQSDFKKEAQEVLQMQPDAIGIFAPADQVKEIIRQLGVSNLHGKRLFGYSFLDERSLRTFLDQYGLKMLLSHVVPDPEKSELEIVKQYRAAMDKKRYPYDALSLEGYVGARLLLEALEKVGVDATTEQLMGYFESLKNYDFYGLKLNFNPETRCLARHVWLEIGPKKWMSVPIEA